MPKKNDLTVAFITETKCPVCGKIFVPSPEHVYHDGKKKVCSWNCHVEAERRKEAKKQKRS